MKPSSAKAKGRRLQNKICKALSRITGIPWGPDCEIAPREMGQKGVDVRLVGRARELVPISFEAKNQERWNINKFVKQAKEQAYEDTYWAVVVSKNRQKSPYVIVDFDFFFYVLLKCWIDKRKNCCIKEEK